MPDQPSPSYRPAQGLDYRLHVPLLVHAAGIQTVVSMIRVTTSYRALELELPVVWLGIISGAFALLPVFLAVSVGRFIDRGNDAKACWIGNGLMLAGCTGIAASPPSALPLLAFNVVLGIGHLFLMASHQMLCVRSAREGSRELAFGNFLVAAAIGHGLGPFLVGWMAGAARIPPTQLLFEVALAGIAAMLLVSFSLRPAARAGPHAEQRDVVPVSELLRTRGLLTLLMASVITITAQDLVVIYLPLLGTERGIDASHIGMLLTVRSAAVMVARLIYVRLIYTVGRVPLTVSSMVGAAAAFAVLALPLPLAAMYIVLVIMGFGLGLASTLSITSVVEVAPAAARATVMSMRISGNRIGQVTLPLIAGVVASATGAAGVLVLIALSLAASGAGVQWVRKDR
jgi:predicted MFS family arabinose efflux permease